MKKVNLFKIILILFISMFIYNSSKTSSQKVFFDFEINSINGEIIKLSDYKNKVILLVNVASYCGFTKQYSDLQNLWLNYKEKGLIVLGVPTNSFNQEKDTEDEIKEFCEVNFNISFPMTSIYEVKGENSHDVYKWAKNSYGNSAVPKWNFHKILINKNGIIVDTFASFTNPNSNKIVKQIEKILN